MDVPAGREYTYTVLSSLGKAVDNGKIAGTTYDPSVDLSNYSPGIYLINLTNENGVKYWVKVVKK